MEPLATLIEEEKQKCEKLELLFGKKKEREQAGNETFAHFTEKKKWKWEKTNEQPAMKSAVANTDGERKMKSWRK